MKKLFYLFCLLFLMGAASQDTGWLARSDCTTLSNPMTDGTVCLNTGSGSLTAGHFYRWNGATWDDVTGGGAGSGTVTSVATGNGITGGTITTTGTISGVNAAADGATKGVAAFTAADFNATTGVISIDYANGQAASASLKGFLTSADWTTFNNKGSGNGTVTSIATTSPIAGGTITSTGTITCATCVTSASALTSGQLMAGAGSQASAVTNLSGDVTTSGSAATTLGATFKIRGISFTLGDPQGSALATTATDYITVPFACTIAAYNIAIDASDSTFRIKFWKVATGTAIPTVSNVINTNGLGVPTGTAVHSTTTSDFTTLAVTANDIIAVNVSTANTIKFINVVLQCNQ